MSGELRATSCESAATSANTRMRRADALAAIYPTLARDDVVVVTIMGAVAVELYNLGHRPGFFYLEHAMGLASSLGLGLALSLPRNPVVVIDGDGSLLMNLGTLTTMARYRPGNLVHVVFDNESLLSVGGFPTATSTGTDLAAVARAAGVPWVCRADTVDAFASAFNEAITGQELATIVAKVEATGPRSFHMDLPMLENRFQFRRYCRALAERAG
jgi:sulfopyruvate decarboxylase subunit beta